MEMIQCPNCRALVGFKKDLGWGTFFAVLVTFGFWLIIVPFYPLRCIRCGLDKVDAINTNRQQK